LTERNRKVNNKVQIDKSKWYTVRPSIIERVKEVLTLTFIFSVFIMWLIVGNA